MNLLLSITIAVTAGIVLGSLFAPLRQRRWKKNPEGWQRAAKTNRAILRFLSRVVYAILGIGLVWTVYFLVLGLIDKTQTEFAEQASSLIVAVLTLFSIIVAYFEFTHRGQRNTGATPPPDDSAPE